MQREWRSSRLWPPACVASSSNRRGPEGGLLPNRMDLELGQFCAGVFQTISVVCLGPAGRDHAFEAFDLVGDCAAAYLNGSMPVRVHTTRNYPTSVTRFRWISSTAISTSSTPPVSSMSMNTSACSPQYASPEWSRVSAGRSQSTQILR